MVRKLKKTTNSSAPILLKMTKDDYIINFGDETITIMERYYKGLDLLANDNLEEAELIFKGLVNGVRAYYDSIIALINIFSERGDFPNIAKIFNVGVKDMKLIFEQLPENGKLPFTYSANKGFLKFLYKLGVKHLNTSRIKDAITNFNLLLKLNPADEFDVLEVLLQALFEKEDYNQILSLTEAVDELKNPSTIYNRILAFLKLGNTTEALDLIKNLNKKNLDVFKDLDLSKDYAMDISEYISLSVIDEKEKYYWNNFFRYWVDEFDSLVFLTKNIEKTDNKKTSMLNHLKTFEHYLEEQDLKENTIKNHIDNLTVFEDILDDFNLTISRFETLVITSNKTTLTKTVTSLNKYYSFIVKDKEKIKIIKESLKNFKDNIIK